MTADQLAACTGAKTDIVSAWLAPIKAAMDRYQINTQLRIAAFLAEISVESAALSKVRESLNYTPSGLISIFNNSHVTRFTNDQAFRLGRTAGHPADQEAIANIAYAGRMGNGPPESGDGWSFRGGGPGQLTFRNNYAQCGSALGVDLVNKPELIECFDIGAMAFGWFWNSGNRTGESFNVLADLGDIDDISRATNGGINGLVARRTAYHIALGALSCSTN